MRSVNSFPRRPFGARPHRTLDFIGLSGVLSNRRKIVKYPCDGAVKITVKEGTGEFARAQKKSCFKKVVSKI